MCDLKRNLHFVDEEERKVEFISFSSYFKDGQKTVTRLLMPHEVERARQAIASNDEYEIDAFCYSVC